MRFFFFFFRLVICKIMLYSFCFFLPFSLSLSSSVFFYYQTQLLLLFFTWAPSVQTICMGKYLEAIQKPPTKKEKKWKAPGGGGPLAHSILYEEPHPHLLLFFFIREMLTVSPLWMIYCGIYLLKNLYKLIK